VVIELKKYLSIYRDMKDRILNGEFKANEQLPFEKDLCTDYEASKMTVKRALDLLVDDGLIIKRRGSGTFVKDLSTNEMIRLGVSSQLKGLSKFNQEKNVSSHILTFDIIRAPEDVADKLNISTNGFVYDIHRVRYVDGDPTVIEKTYMPIDLIPGLKEDHLHSSIYGYIENELDLTIQSAHRRFSVRRSNELEQTYLKLNEGDPVAIAEQTVYLDNGKTMEYSFSTHRADQFGAEFIITR
jgi:GntR family transcriptional regulator